MLSSKMTCQALVLSLVCVALGKAKGKLNFVKSAYRCLESWFLTPKPSPVRAKSQKT